MTRAGDFGNRAAVGAFDFHLADLDENVSLNGIGQRAIWPYGGLRNASGDLFVLERKLVHQMTGGLWLMSDKGGTLQLAPKTVHSARGELRREFTADRHIYRDHLMAKLGDLAPPDEQSFYFDQTDGELVWTEGELCDLRGTAVGPGLQFFIAGMGWPFSYLSRAYWMTGTVLGDEVEGVIFTDYGYWVDRGEWKEQPFFTRTQVAWNVFFNRFDDGSVEWGHIVRGTDGIGAAMVADGDRALVTTGEFDATYVLDDLDFVSSIDYGIGGDRYEFTGEDTTRMTQFSQARGGGYRAQAGQLRRVGDTRTVTNGFVWLECFADRIRAEGLAKG